jgi:hypothetical protein
MEVKMSNPGLSRLTLAWCLTALIAIAFLLGACGAPQAGEPPTATQSAQAQTEVPASATPAPTEFPTETPIPAPTLGPEQPATALEHVAGKWAIRFMGGGGGDSGFLRLADDGTFRMDATAGEHAGMNLGYGTFRFDGDALLLESDACLNPGPTDQFFTCTATYHVFVSMADGKPALLRFAAVDDPFGDRKKTLDGKAFKPYTEP